MSAIDDEIDRLYQGPLTSFTAARDALATQAGARAADVRKLQKPNIAAWAVNQVYWHHRKAFERLVTAARRLRAAHGQQLAGKKADVAGAEVAHRAALQTATREAEDLLRRAGESASPATLQAIADTLRTVLWTEFDGRLTRPLKPTGVEALAALASGPAIVKRPPADVVAFRPAKPAAADPARAAETRRREIATLERDLRDAHADERAAEAALTRAEAALKRAEEERRRLDDQLQRAMETLQRQRQETSDARKRSERAAAERTRLEQRLEQLREQGG